MNNQLRRTYAVGPGHESQLQNQDQTSQENFNSQNVELVEENTFIQQIQDETIVIENHNSQNSSSLPSSQFSDLTNSQPSFILENSLTNFTQTTRETQSPNSAITVSQISDVSTLIDIQNSQGNSHQ